MRVDTFLRKPEGDDKRFDNVLLKMVLKDDIEREEVGDWTRL
jgi:hypothetical protein